MKPTVFRGRLGLQQRVLPAYRAPFFEHLAAACPRGLSVFAGRPRAEESIVPAEKLDGVSFFPAHNLHFGSTRSPVYLCWQAGLLHWLNEWQPRVLVAEANSRNISTLLAVRWMHTRNRPVIGWGLGAPQGRGGFDRLRLSFLRSFDAMIAYSRRGAEEYCAAGFSPDRVFVAPNAATPRPLQGPPVRRPVFDGQPKVLFVGRLQARKRLDLLLQACAALPHELQPRLIIVGEGPARGEFEALARQIYPQAEFCGALRGEALQPLFTAADLFVLPGTGGLAVHEAMAHGLPVIVAEGDGTQVDLVRSDNGWLVSPGNLTALTEALSQALLDPARLRRMGRESFRIVSEEVNFEKMTQVFMAAIASVLPSDEGNSKPGTAT